MKRWLLLLLFIPFAFLIGCNTDLSFSEKSLKSANKDLKEFMESIGEINGAHLYYDGEKTIYVFLNGINVNQSNKTEYFTDFAVDADGNTLNVTYKQAETDFNPNDVLKNQLFYKVSLDKRYEKISPFCNGEITAFAAVSGGS